MSLPVMGVTEIAEDCLEEHECSLETAHGLILELERTPRLLTALAPAQQSSTLAGRTLSSALAGSAPSSTRPAPSAPRELYQSSALCSPPT